MTTYTWKTAGDGEWNDTSKWTPSGVPGATDDAVITATSPSVPSYTVSLNVVNPGYPKFEIGGLTIGSNVILSIDNLAQLEVYNGVIQNSGQIFLSSQSTLYSPSLNINGDGSLQGGGTIIGADNAWNDIYIVPGSTFTNVNNTIAGAFNLEEGTFINDSKGLVDASAALNPGMLRYGNLLNYGIIQASGKAGLLIDTETITNVGGLLKALDGSHGDLKNATIAGGNLSATGSGYWQILGSYTATLDGSSGAIALQSGLFIQDSASLYLKGTVENLGYIVVNSTGDYTSLDVSSAVSLSGGGAVFLGDSSENTINGGISANVLHNFNNWILGAGSILNVTLVNDVHGVISATYADNSLLLATGATITNNGLLAAAGGTLWLDDAVTGTGSGIITNGGTLRAQLPFSQNVSFQGAGALSLGRPYDGVVSGFAATDTIDFRTVSFAAGEQVAFKSEFNSVQTYALEDSSNAVLTTFNVQGYYSENQFTVASDGSGDAAVGLSRSPRLTDTHDFNSDGTSDLLWRGVSSGSVYEWSMTGGLNNSDSYLGNLSGWNEAGIGDFYGNATSDLLWQNQSTGDVYEWQMSSGQHVGNIYLGNLAGWSEIGVGDFSGAGTDDLLWQSQSTGDVYEWTMSNGQHIGSDIYVGNLAGWSEVGIGDFTGAGTDDLLWQNQSTGYVYEWQMSSGQPTGNNVYLGNLAGWSEIGVGDFTGAGTSDLLWQNQSTGDVYEWTMSNGQHVGNDIYLGSLSGWSVVGTGDYTGNGVSDIVWQNQSSGAAYEWTMTNGQHTGDIYLGQLAGWQGK
jgi:hypothetical protein